LNFVAAKEALDTFAWALKTLKVTHGTKCEIVKETQSLLDDAKYELDALKK